MSINRSTLKNLIYERFEQRCQIIAAKRDRYRTELEQEVEELRRNFGEEAVNGLGDSFLLDDSPKPKPAQNQKKKGMRGRPEGSFKKPQPGSKSERVAIALQELSKSGAEFTTAEVGKHLTASGLVFNQKSLTTMIISLAKRLGFTMIRKFPPGGGRPINYYSGPKSAAAQTRTTAVN